MRKYNAQEVESVDIRITRERFPIVFENKVQELIRDCGITREEAERAVDGSVIEVELYYEVGYGLFGVESEAVEATDIYSPYTKDELEDYEDDDE